MNMFKKGPEIKLPQMKVPDLLVDIFYDLRDRHLLPLTLILVVAIVAVPIALTQSSGSEGSETEAAGETAVATPSSTTSQAGQLVAKSAPGLRDYRRRLRGMHVKDPFKQQYTAPEESTSGSSTIESGESSSSTTSGSETSLSETSTQSETESEPASGKGTLTYYSYAIDVRVVPGGSRNAATPDGAGKATVRHNLPELTMLPSRETPAVIYMGSTRDGKKALMVVSSNVDAIFGDAKCVLGSQTCEMIAMEPNLPETFVYGGAGRTYKIELLKIHLVETDRLNRAPLGKPKQGKEKKGS